jgi:hypothetical protein
LHEFLPAGRLSVSLRVRERAADRARRRHAGIG